MYFHQPHAVLRIFKFENKIKEFPLLRNFEFMIEGNVFDDKYVDGEESSKEAIINILKFVKKFVTSEDENYKLLFLDNLPLYTNKLGLDNTIEHIMPILIKIV